jgi:thiamine-phosphate pyrophosphorylase
LPKLSSHHASLRLHAILDVDVADRAGWQVLPLAEAFLAGGARVIQLRAKHLASGVFLQHADRLVRAAAAHDAQIIVNDRADLALLAGAAGAHVGQEDLPPAAVRRLLGPEAIIGFSTHTVPQIEAAVREPVTYIAIGPVFGTATKDTGYVPVGLEQVAKAARIAGTLPVVAIGGITLETAAQVIAAGASGVAVIGDLLAGDNPTERVRRFMEATGSGA